MAAFLRMRRVSFPISWLSSMYASRYRFWTASCSWGVGLGFNASWSAAIASSLSRVALSLSTAALADASSVTPSKTSLASFCSFIALRPIDYFDPPHPVNGTDPVEQCVEIDVLYDSATAVGKCGTVAKVFQEDGVCSRRTLCGKLRINSVFCSQFTAPTFPWHGHCVSGGNSKLERTGHTEWISLFERASFRACQARPSAAIVSPPPGQPKLHQARTPS